MARPGPAVIVLVFVVGVLVALFVVGTGIGLGDRSTGGEGASRRTRERLAERWLGRRPVAASEARNTCPGALADLQVSAPCTVAVAPSDKLLRTATVSGLGGAQIDAEWRPRGGPSLPLKLRVRGEERKRIDVFEEGGVLTLRCRVAGPLGCRARIE